MTGLELVRYDGAEPVGVVNPDTGEVVGTERPVALVGVAEWVGDLAAARLAIQEWEAAARAAKRLIDSLIVPELDRAAAWTRITPQGLKVSARSPAPVDEYVPEDLRFVLDVLVQEGVITTEARDAAVVVEHRFRVSARGVAAVLKVPGVAERVADCAIRVEPSRPVKVTR